MLEQNCKMMIENGSGITERPMVQGMNLYKALLAERPEGFDFNAPCGGNGTCGKCKVKASGKISDLTKNELGILSQKELQSGIRLACQVTVLGDVQVESLIKRQEASIQTEGLPVKVEMSPLARRKPIHLKPETPGVFKDDHQRLSEALDITGLKIDFPVLKKISQLVDGNHQDLCAVVSEDRLADIYPDPSKPDDYGFAVDIGSTTVVGYLVNLSSGHIEETVSRLNPQRVYGADVISRISFSKEDPKGCEVLHNLILEQIQEMLNEVLSKKAILKEQVCAATFAGNTTMMHFLMGLKPDRIGSAPFTPVWTSAYFCSAGELGLSLYPECPVYLLPGISGYVGADIVAGMLACSLRDRNKTQLLIDIGTNGEMALSKKGEMVCCAVAAGPAFEGARIQCGIGGVKGAVDSVWIKEGELGYHVIGEQDPIGICGSGLLDFVAVLVKLGIIDETGRFADEEEWPPRALGLLNRMDSVNGERAFVLVPSANTPVYLTQQDIREVQLAKAAVNAGIRSLLKHQSIQFEDVDTVWLAGGFGNKLKEESAVIIGLLPKELSGRIKFAGNTSATGAIMSLLSGISRRECDIIKKETHYLELSGSSEFNDAFMDALIFD